MYWGIFHFKQLFSGAINKLFCLNHFILIFIALLRINSLKMVCTKNMHLQILGQYWLPTWDSLTSCILLKNLMFFRFPVFLHTTCMNQGKLILFLPADVNTHQSKGIPWFLKVHFMGFHFYERPALVAIWVNPKESKESFALQKKKKKGEKWKQSSQFVSS